MFLHVITRSEQRERRGNPEKSFYVRRPVGLWIAILTTLQTVQSFAMTVIAYKDSTLAIKKYLKHAVLDYSGFRKSVVLLNLTGWVTS